MEIHNCTKNTQADEQVHGLYVIRMFDFGLVSKCKYVITLR